MKTNCYIIFFILKRALLPPLPLPAKVKEGSCPSCPPSSGVPDNTQNQNTLHQTNMLISNRTADAVYYCNADDAITQKIPPNYLNMADAEQEETMIRHYFSLNYDYNTILSFLERNHGIKMSKRTLLNRLNEYQLRRRHRNIDEEIVRECILRELDGSGSLLGYRSMWRILHSKYGINVPRSVVQVVLAELDPVETQQRKAHRLKRRRYSNPGPNYCWHSDGYDKLKPYGFPIHACIDGFSRRIIWLKLTKSNNNPHIIASFFLESVRELQACPTLLRTDRGTENGSMATVQCFLRRNHNDSLSAWFGCSSLRLIAYKSKSRGIVVLSTKELEFMVD